MRHSAIALILLLIAACGGKANQAADMQASAKVAERNLVKIRDAVLDHYRKNNVAPESMDLLAVQMEPSDVYAELGYQFYELEFSKDGALKHGWFMASPMEGRKALRVRLNGVTGEFDYASGDEPYAPAPKANRQP